MHKRYVVISGKNDPEAISATLAARDLRVGLIRDPVAYGGLVSELRDNTKVHFVDSDRLQGKKEALRLLEEREAEAFLDTRPVDSGFFSLLMESGVGPAKHHLLSYVSVFLTPKNGQITLLTDTLINGASELDEKAHIAE